MKKTIMTITIILFAMIFSLQIFATEGRIEISEPITINTPGSYILINDIEADTSGIRIYSSDVKLDLNGFTIRHTSNTTNIVNGIEISPYSINIEITNGTITGFTGHGISITGTTTPSAIKISNMRISENALAGIRIQCIPGYMIDNCLIMRNGDGIITHQSGLIINNVICGNARYGLYSAVNTVGYRSNVFYDNKQADVEGNASDLGGNLLSGIQL